MGKAMFIRLIILVIYSSSTADGDRHNRKQNFVELHALGKVNQFICTLLTCMSQVQ